MSLIYKRVLTYVLDDKLIVNYFFVATDSDTPGSSNLIHTHSHLFATT